MTVDDYEYLAEVWGKETVDRPGALWRRRGGETEYLSMVDWAWHLAGNEVDLPHPDLLVPISHDHVQTLLGDHQRFAKYWVSREPLGSGTELEVRVYRQLPSPERRVEEVYSRDNEWIATRAIGAFLVGGPHDVPELEAIDAATAERLIQKTRGISGATEL